LDYFRFKTSLPDDALWDGDDNIRPAGLNVAHAIVSSLPERGMTFGSLYQRSHYGWEFDICTLGSPSHSVCQCVLQPHFDSYLLALERRRSLFGWLYPSPPPESYGNATQAVRMLLDASPAFTDAVTFDESELANIEAEAAQMERRS
jgi:hypothetical protein